MTPTIQIFGLAMIAFALFCFYRTLHRTKVSWIRTILVVIILVGAALLFHHRITQMKVLGIASITAAQERAETGSKQIDEILEKIEGQAVAVGAVAKQAAEARQFLVDVLRNDSSLRVVEYAGLYFAKESRTKLKRLAVKQHIEWWEKNKDSIP